MKRIYLGYCIPIGVAIIAIGLLVASSKVLTLIGFAVLILGIVIVSADTIFSRESRKSAK